MSDGQQTAGGTSLWRRLFDGPILAQGLLVALLVTVVQAWAPDARRLSWLVPVCLLGLVVPWLSNKLRSVMRSRQHQRLQIVNAFIGAMPFAEGDGARLYGREAEVTAILTMLIDPNRRLFAITGESGSGKTSLLRARLLEELDRRGFPAAYVRTYGPGGRGIATVVDRFVANAGGTPPARVGKSVAAAEIVQSLGIVRELRGAPPVLFIDHFEEFFTQDIESGDEGWLAEFLDALAGAGLPAAKVVFCLRDDYFGYFAGLEGMQAALVPGSRYHLEPFGEEVAAQVIQSLLSSQPGETVTGTWAADLVHCVVDDLAQTSFSGDDRRVVLPAELQIVGQMIQRRGITKRADYPGKEVLLQQYLQESLAALSDPDRAKKVLRRLVNDSTGTKAAPRTAEAIAAELTGTGVHDVRDVLERLAQSRLLTSGAVEGGGKAYELSHDYLADAILSWGASRQDRSATANQLLRESRKRAASIPNARIPIKACFAIRRYATELTAEDRVRLERSFRSFNLKAAIALFVVVVLRLTPEVSVHMDYVYREPAGQMLVARRGLPVLAPVLGSDEIVIDTGYSRGDLANFAYYWVEKRQPYLDLWPGLDHFVDYFISDWTLMDSIRDLSMAKGEQDRKAFVLTMAEADKANVHELVLHLMDPGYRELWSLQAPADFEFLLALLERVASGEPPRELVLELVPVDFGALLWAVSQPSPEPTVLAVATEVLKGDDYWQVAPLARALDARELLPDETLRAWRRGFAIPSLTLQFSYDGEDLVEATVAGLARRGALTGADLTALRGLLESAYSRSRIEALLRAIITVRTDLAGVRELLLELFEGGGSYRLKGGALRSLASMPQHDALLLERMRAHLESDEDDLRLGAACFLLHVGERDAAVQTALMDWLERHLLLANPALMDFAFEYVEDAERLGRLCRQVLQDDLVLDGAELMERAAQRLAREGAETELLEMARAEIAKALRDEVVDFRWDRIAALLAWGAADDATVVELLSPFVSGDPELVVGVLSRLERMIPALVDPLCAELEWVLDPFGEPWLELLAASGYASPTLTNWCLEQLPTTVSAAEAGRLLALLRLDARAERAAMDWVVLQVERDDRDWSGTEVVRFYGDQLRRTINATSVDQELEALLVLLMGDEALGSHNYRSAVQESLVALGEELAASRRNGVVARLRETAARGALTSRMAAMNVVYRLETQEVSDDEPASTLGYPEPTYAELVAAGPWGDDG